MRIPLNHLFTKIKTSLIVFICFFFAFIVFSPISFLSLSLMIISSFLAIGLFTTFLIVVVFLIQLHCCMKTHYKLSVQEHSIFILWSIILMFIFPFVSVILIFSNSQHLTKLFKSTIDIEV